MGLALEPQGLLGCAQLTLVALAPVWEAARAPYRLADGLDHVPAGAATCLHVGFVRLLTGVLGWMRAPVPSLPEASWLSDRPALGWPRSGCPSSPLRRPCGCVRTVLLTPCDGVSSC